MPLLELHFKDWLVELERAAYHEAGHAIAMGVRSPGWFKLAFLVRNPTHPDGWDGATVPHPHMPTPPNDDLYFIGACGSLAEAKRANGLHLDCAALHELAAEIIHQMGVPAFPVHVPILGQQLPVPASCSSADFNKIPLLQLQPLSTALSEACEFLEDPVNWQRVQTAAATLSIAPNVLTVLP